MPEDQQTTRAGAACGTRTNTRGQAVDCGGCGGSKTCQSGACVCPAGTKACNGICIAGDVCCSNADCPANQVCQSGQCGCPEGTQDCDGDGTCECGTGQECRGSTCTTLGTDMNCAACNDACDGGQVCWNDWVYSRRLCVTACTTHLDCVPFGCCHPMACAPYDQQLNCSGVGCQTDECRLGEIGCDAYCACESGQCVPIYPEQ